MSFAFLSYTIRISFLYQSYVSVCHSYLIRMSLVDTRMSFVCLLYVLVFYLHVLVCHSYVSSMYSYVMVCDSRM